MVDDVITSGKSCSDGKTLISDLDGNLRRCIIGMDRQEKGIDSDLSAVQMFEENTGVPVTSVMNLELLKYFLLNEPKKSFKGKMFRQIIAYDEQYGVN